MKRAYLTFNGGIYNPTVLESYEILILVRELSASPDGRIIRVTINYNIIYEFVTLDKISFICCYSTAIN